MKKYTIIFWITTSIIFLFEGVMPALTGHTEVAKEGVRHLGYPDYFRVMLNIFKVAGALALIIPMVPARVKEWAYAGLAITMISAFISNWAVDGFSAMLMMPLVILGIHILSYISYHKMRKAKENRAVTS